MQKPRQKIDTQHVAGKKKKKNFRRTHAGSSNWSMVIPFTKLGNQKRGLSLGQKKEKFSF